MTPAYPRCPAYLRNTSNSRRSTSRLCLSCSCGEKTGVRFLTVIVRSPRTAVFTSLLYLTCACIKSLPYDNRNRMLETPRASTAKVLALGRRHLWTKCPEVLRALGAPPLALDGEDAVQGGGGDPQPLGHSDVIFYRFIDIAPAYHQHAGAPEQVAPHINTAFMLLRHRVIEEQRQIEHRADGGISRIIDNAAVFSCLLHDLALAAAPCGGHIRKGSLHNQNLRFFSIYNR